jgi:hypothetical protein
MARTREIIYTDEDYNVRIVVRRATALDGMERSILITEGLRASRAGGSGEEETTPTKPPMQNFFQMYTYPNSVACTSEIVNVPYTDEEGNVLKGDDGEPVMPEELLPGEAEELSFDAFMHLPDQLVSMWHAAALELNPHWMITLPGTPEEEEGEESEPDSEGGSQRNSLSGSSRRGGEPIPPATKTTRKTGASTSPS